MKKRTSLAKKLNPVIFSLILAVCTFFYVPMDALAAPAPTDCLSNVSYWVGSQTIVSSGKLTGLNGSLYVVRDNSSSGLTSGEFATYTGNLLFGFYISPSGLSNYFDSDGFCHFNRINIYFPFSISSYSDSSSDGRLYGLNKGSFGVPFLSNQPSATGFYGNIYDSGSVYTLQISLTDFNYFSGSWLYISVPYTCACIGANISDSGVFSNYFNLTVVPCLSVQSSGLIGNSNTFIIDYGRSTSEALPDNVQDLVDGYNSSAGDSASSEFGSGVAELDQVENSLFNSSTDAISDFTFFDIGSVPAITTGVSFVSSCMAMIFDSSGGLSGAGVVMSISLCVLIASVIIGIWRYWHKDG